MRHIASGNDERANELIDEFTSAHGGDRLEIRRFLLQLLDPDTREAAFNAPQWILYMGIPNDSGMWRGILYILLGDEKVWNEIDRMYEAGEATYMIYDVMLATYRDHDLLSDPRYRQGMERRGLVKIWREQGPPDFCAEGYQSWICELETTSD
jgi:hypothetical protein